MPPKPKPDGLFAEALHAQMEKHKMDIRALSIATGASYEHIRKLVKGLTTPSPILMNAICKALSWNAKEAEKLALRDQMLRKYGDISAEMQGRSPAVLPFERVIPKLTDEQRKSFLTQMKAVADGNK